jgi:hypothetical protein
MTLKNGVDIDYGSANGQEVMRPGIASMPMHVDTGSCTDKAFELSII